MTEPTGLMDAARAAHQAARAEAFVEQTREEADRQAADLENARLALQDLIGTHDAISVDLIANEDGVTADLHPIWARYNPETRSWHAANVRPACPNCRQHPEGPRLETLADLGAALAAIEDGGTWEHDCQPAPVHHVAEMYADDLGPYLDSEHAAGYRLSAIADSAGRLVVVTRLRTAG